MTLVLRRRFSEERNDACATVGGARDAAGDRPCPKDQTPSAPNAGSKLNLERWHSNSSSRRSSSLAKRLIEECLASNAGSAWRHRRQFGHHGLRHRGCGRTLKLPLAHSSHACGICQHRKSPQQIRTGSFFLRLKVANPNIGTSTPCPAHGLIATAPHIWARYNRNYSKNDCAQLRTTELSRQNRVRSHCCDAPRVGTSR